MLDSILKSQWTWWIGFVIVFIPLFMIMLHNMNKEEQAKNALEHKKEISDIKAEVARRAKAKELSKTPIIAEQNSIDKTRRQDLSDMNKVSKNKDILTTTQGITNTSESNVIMEGPHKGMTLTEFEAHKRRGERLKVYNERMSNHLDRLQKFTTASLESSRNEYAVMLSLFKTLSPEQLKYAKEYALKEFPSKEVNELFDAIDSTSSKSLEEIGEAADAVLISDAAADIIRREISIESESLRQEYIDIYGIDHFEKSMQELKKQYSYNNQ